MYKYVEYIRRHKKLLILLFLALNFFAVVGISRIKLDPGFDIFTLQKSEYKSTIDEMNNLFNTSDQTIILIESNSKKITSKVITEYRTVQRFLENIRSIKDISGPAPDIISLEGKSVDLDGKLNSKDLEFLKEHYKGMGKLSPLIKKGDKIYGVFTLYPNKQFNSDNLTKIERFLDNNNFTYYITGDMYMQMKMIDYIYMILLFIPPTALLLILIMFKTQMKTIKATLLSILPAGIAALWTMGIIGWIGKPVSIITVLAPIFTVVIGSADGLHFVSHVQDSRAEGNDTIKSIINTLKMVGIPMIITTITSMAGFLSLLVMNTRSIHDLALFASLGIMLAGIATWYVLPLFLTGNIDINIKISTKNNFTYIIKRLWGVPSILTVIILIIIFLFGAQKLNTEFNHLFVFRNYTGVYKSFNKIMDVNNGSIPTYLYIKTDKDPLKPEYAKKLMDLEEELIESKHATKVISVYDAYALINSSILELEDNVYPKDMSQVDYINSLISKDNEDPTRNLINRNKNITRMIIFPVNLKNKTLNGIKQKIDYFNNNNDDIKARITGSQYMIWELNKSMISNQAKSIMLAFALIFSLLLISLRKIRPAIMSLVPIVITILIIFGFMGYINISLNLFTATIFSITIGVGIDYAVHFTSVWMNFKKNGYSSQKAVKNAYKYTARPIIANALGLAIGLSALLLSPLRIHLYMSLLMWISMMAGVFLTLSLLPTILKDS